MTSTRRIHEYLKEYEGASLSIVGPFCSKKGFQDPVLFIDRGVRAREAKEGFSLGDGDSSNLEDMDLLFPGDKDFSDLEGALREIPPLFSRIRLYGFLGGRKDHEFGNLICLYSFLSNYEIPCILDLNEKIYFIHKSQLNLNYTGDFSLFQMEENEVEIKGAVDFPYSGVMKPMVSHGLSNRAKGNFFISSKKPSLLFLNKNLY